MTNVTAMLLDSDGLAGFAIGGIGLLFVLAVAAVFVIGMWKTFEKAGQPGWACLIPIYNMYILMTIAGRPAWWLLLFFIPLANLVVAFIVAIDIAKAFGKSAAWGVILLGLLGGIGYLILGFGEARYLGPPQRALTATA